MRPYNLNGGRPSKLTDEQKLYIKQNMKKPLRLLADELGVSHVTVYYSFKGRRKCNTQQV